ncbi:COP9 signalosome complex subunit 8 [Trichogramma pretiosum]|uniref:COP9 signalosome complex subunit 8 n=1 Tax=Trichogramma pretiosum TaxID=7493 RepID=UPI0006C97B73|nr:COP9 signalosome complex subunit 8 [Trichogramma pretiosum]
MVVLNNLEEILVKLEEQELDSDDGSVNPETYCQMLAIYLYQNELCLAKFLWQRIPVNVKMACSDLRKIWSVGKKMWTRDWEEVHIALNVEWNPNVREVMQALKGEVQERVLKLVGDAYASLDLVTLSKMIGMSLDETKVVAEQRGWNLVGNTVKPTKAVPKSNASTTETIAEEQLHKLTQFVSFLEN